MRCEVFIKVKGNYELNSYLLLVSLHDLHGNEMYMIEIPKYCWKRMEFLRVLYGMYCFCSACERIFVYSTCLWESFIIVFFLVQLIEIYVSWGNTFFLLEELDANVTLMTSYISNLKVDRAITYAKFFELLQVFMISYP